MTKAISSTWLCDKWWQVSIRREPDSSVSNERVPVGLACDGIREHQRSAVPEFFGPTTTAAYRRLTHGDCRSRRGTEARHARGLSLTYRTTIRIVRDKREEGEWHKRVKQILGSVRFWWSKKPAKTTGAGLKHKQSVTECAMEGTGMLKVSLITIGRGTLGCWLFLW